MSLNNLRLILEAARVYERVCVCVMQENPGSQVGSLELETLPDIT